MSLHEEIKLFEQSQVRSVWDDEKEQWFFSVVDVVEVLTESKDPANYIKQLKHRDSELAKGWVQIVPPPYDTYSWRSSEGELRRCTRYAKEWSGKSVKEYKQLKGLKKESLRDNMTNVELALNTLAEASATEIAQQRSPKGKKETTVVVKQGGSVAKAARVQLEKQLGRSVVTPMKASDYIQPIETTEAKEIE